MRSFKTKTVIATAVAVLAFTGVAYAGAGTLRHDRDKLKDGSCQTTVAAGDRVRLHDNTGDQDQLKLKDGSCLTTTVAAGDRVKSRLLDGTKDRDQLKDGSCLTTVAAAGQHGARLQGGAGDRDQLKLQDGSCLTVS